MKRQFPLPKGFRKVDETVVGPDGQPLTRADLPAAGTKRWVTRRKAEVVAGVRGGLISLDEACRRYALSVEEFLSWERLLDEHGLSGLRATRARRNGRRPPVLRSATLAAARQDLPTR